ncbi:lysophospholipid acyltransferase family protein [Ferrovibrio sp.]|uniref:lysophospholipid acyltransferase family protein n=1 Tax=Ferrovibrio sp. TaxID=1917215 RepID=UPI0025BD84AF|nr:lysophospholipid acyltransferase family protein [Ferrovibrio sp.]MBX3456082.1 1-acyl-sn-glycerol-3-phosphate acyltransferase [Ferrovibrio sp.]
MSLRAAITAGLFLIFTLPLIPVQMLLLRLKSPARRTLPTWYHRGVSWLLRLKIRVHGRPYDGGGPVLFVTNHISWLDIVALSTPLPVSFIAKSEVETWPFFGLLARLQRTVFVDRNARQRTAEHRDEMRERLAAGDNLILFPEGTSSDGLRVLPFKSAFFATAEQPVNGKPLVVQPVSLGYAKLNHMPVGRRWMAIFAWLGDEDLLPHLWRYLKAGPAEAVIEFHHPVTIQDFASRKAMAAYCHQVVIEGLSDINAGREPGPRSLPKSRLGPEELPAVDENGVDESSEVAA